MFWKIVAVASLVALPFSLTLWHKSHRHPQWYRCDLTAYKSVSVTLRGGLCAINMLSMPTKTALRSEFRTPLSYDPIPKNRTLMLSSSVAGPYRNTWLVFPLWLTSLTLMVLMFVPVLRGPVRRRYRQWQGCCVECGYLLHGLRSRRCPECGTRY